MRAHPSKLMEQQAKSLHLPYEVIDLQEPFEKSYEEALVRLKETYGVETIVTGDIAEVMEQPNWITNRCKAVGLKAFLPLWHLDREVILNKLVQYHFKVIFSCVKAPWFTVDWLGREITLESIQSLKELHAINAVDLCGENGEYHTIVLNGPGYSEEIPFRRTETYEDKGTFLFNF